jgi:NDP-sugar pyrophosphorylase family protein
MAKKRISLTLEEEILNKIDVESERLDSNRSNTVERIANEYFDRKGLDTAVVLCGDPELRSLELHKGQSILSHILDHLDDQSFSRVILLAGENRQRLKEEFETEYGKLSLEYVEEEPRGTAAALKNVESELNSSFALLNGHVVAEVDFDEMLQTHRGEDSVATMALTTVENPEKYGVAKMKGQTVLGFEEKPENPPSRLINAGTYIVEPTIFERMDSDDLEEVFEQLASKGKLAGYIYGGRWVEV